MLQWAGNMAILCASTSLMLRTYIITTCVNCPTLTSASFVQDCHLGTSVKNRDPTHDPVPRALGTPMAWHVRGQRFVFANVQLVRRDVHGSCIFEHHILHECVRIFPETPVSY